ncbi:hypothetical protein AB0O91_05105 [Kitasatospora sp. NPDC089797]|uniref:hypothetical protein n=1 Tax=Kitasatospora sp. NPDC089797 TaxID=3155298 RepID=UPI0034467093
MKKFQVALVSTAVLAGIGLAAAPLTASAASSASSGPRTTVPGVPKPTSVPITPGVPVKPGKPGVVPGVPKPTGVPISPGVPVKPGKPGVVRAADVEVDGATAAPVPVSPLTCSDPVFGGNFLCGGYYGPTGATFFDFRDGSRLILVIGTNHQVYTRSTIANSTKLTAWKSLGGSMDGGLGISAQSLNGTFRFDVHGTDGRWWSRVRDTNGNWSAWGSRA